ncbi:MAG: AraC family transcriptional regulator [Steroidobacteraceae bacterium]
MWSLARIDPAKGLFRTMVAGQGHTLHDAFDRLERTQAVDRAVWHRQRDMFGARVAVPSDDGRGYWDFMRARDDIYVVVENFSFNGPRLERITDDGIVQFYFELSGDLTMAVPGATLRLNQPSLLVYYQPRGMEFTAWTEPSARQRSVIINVRPQFLLDTFLCEGEGVPAQMQLLLSGLGTDAMPYCQLPLTAHMFELITKLVDAPYSGVLGLLNTEAVVTELLCAGVAHLGLQSGRPHDLFSARELRCLHVARDILKNEMQHPPTIPEVARAIGLNETTLKHGFRTMFGETPFDFSVRCRMQRALQLLREQRMPMARIAEAVGYRHPTSFATAFRRHFGLQPKQIRRARRR